MGGRSPTQLLDIRLVEERRIDESYFQDYAKVHERLDKIFEKKLKPLPPSEGEAVAEAFVAWLSVQAEKGVPADRLTHYLRCGLGHICVEMSILPDLSPENIASSAYDELRQRGWIEAIFDPIAAAAVAKRLGIVEHKPVERKVEAASKKAPRPASKPTNASGKTTAAKKISASKSKEEKVMSNIEEPGKAPVAPAAAQEKPESEKKAQPVKKASAKKPAAKATAKKPAAKKVAEKKPAAKKPAAKAAAKKAPAKKVAEKKPAAKKPAAKAAAKKAPAKKVAAKKPAAKKVAEKKAAAKKPAAKKPVAKASAKKVAAKKPAAKAAAKKPVAKKPAAKAAAKKPAAKKATK